MTYLKIRGSVWIAITVSSLGFTELFACNDLCGLWVASDKPRGGVRSLLEYTGDGRVISRFVDASEWRYQADGARLTVADKNGQEMIAYRYTVRGNELELSRPGKAPIRFTRAQGRGAGQENRLLGVWCGSHGEATTDPCFVFIHGGSLFYTKKRMPGETVSRYRVLGQRIEISRQGASLGMDEWMVNDGVLTLRSEGKTYRYTRLAERDYVRGQSAPAQPAVTDEAR
ncbi:MAG: hypothetical protein ACREWG_15855 [Gammaproteobacteria bacterium]